MIFAKKKLLIGFLLTLVLSVNISFPKLLNSNLELRLLFISIFTFVGAFFIRTQQENDKFRINYIITTYGIFAIYASISILWATSYTASLVDVSAIIIFLILFLLLQRLISEHKEFVHSSLIKTILLMFFFSLIVFFINSYNYQEISDIVSYKYRGISSHENLYSSFLFLSSIGSLYGFLYFKDKWKFISLFAFIAQVIIVLVLKTRAVLLGYTVLIAAFGLILFFRNILIPKNKIFLISIGLTICSTLFFIKIFHPTIRGYLGQQENISKDAIIDLNTLNERMVLWDASYKIINDNIITGSGAGNWKIDINKYSTPNIYRVQQFNINFQRPHNEYIKILSEYGIMGFLLISFIVNYVLTSLLSRLNTKERINIIVLISGILGFLTIAFFSFPLERAEHNVVVVILLTLTCYHIKPESKKIFKLKSNLIRYLRISFLILILFVIAINFSRVKSNYHLKKMFTAWRNNKNLEVIKQCNLANTIFTKLDDYSMPIHWYRGNAYANLNSFEYAKNDFIMALKHNPYSYNVLNDLGSAYYKLNEIDSAIIFYKKAIDINPRFDDPKLNLTAIYLNKGDYKEANKWNESLLMVWPPINRTFL